MTLHELGELRGTLYTDPTLEKELPTPNLLLLLEQFVELEKQVRMKVCGIFIPEANINDQTEIMIFVAPFDGNNIFPTVKGLNDFRRQHVIAELLIPARDGEDACSSIKVEIDERLRDHVEDGSLFVPTVTYADRVADIVDEVTRRRIPRMTTSPVLRALGLEKTPLPDKNIERKQFSHEEITTTVFVHPNTQTARLAAQSVQLLYMCREVVLGNSSIFSNFHYLVARCLQDRHVQLLRAGRFQVTSPEIYLREFGIPLTQEEAAFQEQ